MVPSFASLTLPSANSGEQVTFFFTLVNFLQGTTLEINEDWLRASKLGWYTLGIQLPISLIWVLRLVFAVGNREHTHTVFACGVIYKALGGVRSSRNHSGSCLSNPKENCSMFLTMGAIGHSQDQGISGYG